MKERRTQRSHVPDEALSLFFSSVATQADCSAIALADDEGLLISGYGNHQDDLAAMGVAGLNDVSFAPMNILDQELVLVWQGGEPSIPQTCRAVERIVSAQRLD